MPSRTAARLRGLLPRRPRLASTLSHHRPCRREPASQRRSRPSPTARSDQSCVATDRGAGILFRRRRCGSGAPRVRAVGRERARSPARHVRLRAVPTRHRRAFLRQGRLRHQAPLHAAEAIAPRSAPRLRLQNRTTGAERAAAHHAVHGVPVRRGDLSKGCNRPPAIGCAGAKGAWNAAAGSRRASPPMRAATWKRAPRP